MNEGWHPTTLCLAGNLLLFCPLPLGPDATGHGSRSPAICPSRESIGCRMTPTISMHATSVLWSYLLDDACACRCPRALLDARRDAARVTSSRSRLYVSTPSSYPDNTTWTGRKVGTVDAGTLRDVYWKMRSNKKWCTCI
ncbi:hypothetical protein K525DRAFT_257075, partial [Schizophyllum commune Loenen D]